MKIILTILVILLLLLFLIFLIRNYKVQRNLNQKLFLSGMIPSPLPVGFYKGTVTGLKTSWQGKKFDASNSTGVNIINNKPVYPFKTYIDKGVQDKNLNVLKIDYNIPGNPFWLRFILDEIVETKTNQYLGKIHLNLIPGFPFSLGYFRLEK